MRISDWSSDVCSSDLSRLTSRSPDRTWRGIRRPFPVRRFAPAWFCQDRGGQRTAHDPALHRAFFRFNKDTQIFPCAFLDHKFVERFWPQRRIDVLHTAARGDEAVRDGKNGNGWGRERGGP